MNARPADRLAIALAQLNATVGDVAGNAEKVRRARADRGRAGRRSGDLSRAVHLRLSARGSGAQAGVPGGLPRGDRGAGARDRRRRPGGAGRRAVGRGRQALQRLRAARGRQDRGRALQGRSAELRRVRREARVRARPDAGPDRAQGRAHRRADLRGHLGRRRGRVHRRDRRAKSCWCRTARPIGATRPTTRLNIAVARVVESGLPLVYLNMVGGQDELVFDGASFGSMPTARSRSSCRPFARPWSRRTGCARTAAGAALDGRVRRDRGGRRGGLCAPACSACATMSTRTASRAWCSACPAASTPRSARRWRSMRSGRARARRDAALSLHLAGLADDAALRREGARRPLRYRADRRSRSKASRRRCSRCSPARNRDITEENIQSARARHHPDGDVQQVRRDGRDHRQQVGNVGRLRHALRRHEWRLQSDQGSLQDARSFACARLRNGWKPPGALGPDGVVIPERIIAKPPTAELRENQKDQDTLPPYDVLDAILERPGRTRGADRRHRARGLRRATP